MQVVIAPDGTVRTLYDEDLDLSAVGRVSIARASEVEPDADGRWWADMRRSGGSRLGPFARRSEAIAAEREWLTGRGFPTPAAEPDTGKGGNGA